MGKSHPIALRESIVVYVEKGNSERKAALCFKVSRAFVRKVLEKYRKTGSLEPNPSRIDKLAAHEDFVRARLEQNCNLTDAELCAELAAMGVKVHRTTVRERRLKLDMGGKRLLRNRASSNGRTSIEQANTGVGGAIPIFESR
jgi:transposase